METNRNDKKCPKCGKIIKAGEGLPLSSGKHWQGTEKTAKMLGYVSFLFNCSCGGTTSERRTVDEWKTCGEYKKKKD